MDDAVSHVVSFYTVVFGGEHEDIAYYMDLMSAIARLMRQHREYVAGNESFMPFLGRYMWNGAGKEMTGSRQLSMPDVEAMVGEALK